MTDSANAYLQVASSAMSRGDYLTAIAFARRASALPNGQASLRCDAYMLLALTSLELGLAEDALAFAVGAHLASYRVQCAEREQRAASIVAVVVSHHPHLGEDDPCHAFH